MSVDGSSSASAGGFGAVVTNPDLTESYLNAEQVGGGVAEDVYALIVG